MTYYARFETIDGHLFRFDTRIYLGKHDANEQGKCIGAIVGKNPGSAKPTQLGVLAELTLDGDKMLPSVRNRFTSAYQATNSVIPNNAYVQVWNLFYLCNPLLDEACLSISTLKNAPLCTSESGVPSVVWFAWGGNDHRLRLFKERFTSSPHRGFYYDHGSGTVVSQIPSIDDFAKHPQGMPARPIVDHLARLLC